MSYEKMLAFLSVCQANAQDERDYAIARSIPAVDALNEESICFLAQPMSRAELDDVLRDNSLSPAIAEYIQHTQEIYS